MNTNPLWMWGIFITIILALLFFDLGIFHRKQREISLKKSLWMSAGYIAIALLFGLWIFFQLGEQKGKEYLTGFLIEKSLSLDNLFVISLIFRFFSVPLHDQHRVLFFGILGAIFLRAMMIGLGATLIYKFEWMIYLFSLFLIVIGLKMILIKERPFEVQNTLTFKLMKRFFNITPTLQGKKFFLLKKGLSDHKNHLWVTPLFASLVLIELIDLIFAIDSIPAIFAITTDLYIVYTSNIFAILGMRSLYFALEAVMGRFAYFKQSLALVLIFIGFKTFIPCLLGIEEFPISLSLAVTFGLLGSGILFSLWQKKQSI